MIHEGYGDEIIFDFERVLFVYKMNKLFEFPLMLPDGHQVLVPFRWNGKDGKLVVEDTNVVRFDIPSNLHTYVVSKETANFQTPPGQEHENVCFSDSCREIGKDDCCLRREVGRQYCDVRLDDE